MSLRKALDDFLAAHGGINHLVYGDVKTGMVLYAGSAAVRGQEDHDRLMARGIDILGTVSSGAEPETPLQVIVSDMNGIAVFVRAADGGDEGIFMQLDHAGNAIEIADAAAAALVQFAGE